MSIYAGIDLGGTKIAVTLLGSEGGADGETRIAQHSQPTQAHEGPDAVLRRIADAFAQTCHAAGIDPAQVGAVGLGVPAVIDLPRGMTLLMPNLPGNWFEKPVVGILSGLVGRPVWLVNDARAFTLAEANLGAGRGAQTVVCFTVGTGIGGGIALGGRLHLGRDARAAEFGHQTIDPNGPPCGCGNRGCLESLVSGPAIAAMGIRAVLQGVTTEIGRLVNQDITQITPEMIKRAAEAGDSVAREILERAGTYLGIGVSNVTTLLSPDRVVIGGGVAALGVWIFDPVRAVMRRRCTTVDVEHIELVRAALGGEAGAIGAALWAKQNSA